MKWAQEGRSHKEEEEDYEHYPEPAIFDSRVDSERWAVFTIITSSKPRSESRTRMADVFGSYGSSLDPLLLEGHFLRGARKFVAPPCRHTGELYCTMVWVGSTCSYEGVDAVGFLDAIVTTPMASRYLAFYSLVLVGRCWVFVGCFMLVCSMWCSYWPREGWDLRKNPVWMESPTRTADNSMGRVQQFSRFGSAEFIKFSIA